MSLVVLGDLALGIFFKMVIMHGISAAARISAAPGGRACVACAHCVRTHAHTYTRRPKQIIARYI